MQTAPKALNATGTVVGGLRPTVDALPAFVYTTTVPNNRSHTTSATFPRRELPVPLGATWVLPNGINAQGQIAGFANEQARQTRHAVLWERLPIKPGAVAIPETQENYTVHPLDDGGALSSEATAINARGEIAGIRWTRQGICQACYWRDGLCNEVDSHAPVAWRPTGLNEAGDMVGWGRDALNNVHLFSWHQHVLTDLGRGYQIALNQRGQLAGDYETPDHRFHACLWNGKHRLPLPMLPGTNESHALALNDHGQIVGRASWSNSLSNSKLNFVPDTEEKSREEQGTKNGTPHPVLWEKGHALDLNTLVPAGSSYVLEEAIAINNAGQNSLYRPAGSLGPRRPSHLHW